STPMILHLYSVKGESWGAEGAKISLSYFPYNFKTNSLFYFINREFPLLFSLFGFLGLFFWRGYFKEKGILLSWFLVFWGVFLFFYAGSYRFGQDVRFSLLSYPPLAIFGACGFSFLVRVFERRIKFIKQILIFFVLFNFTSFLPFAAAEGEEAWAARKDHEYAIEFTKLLPPNSIVYTHNPNIFLLNKKSAIQSAMETYNPGIIQYHLEQFKGGVYLHYNYWSNTDDPIQRSFTENILNNYNYITVREYYYRNYKYGLYKITGKRIEFYE
ncbi:MAG: hypothetical protein ABIN61_08125, partial [candidate division WOR-3 bacterium]